MNFKKLKRFAGVVMVAASLAPALPASAQDNSAFPLYPTFAEQYRSATFGESVWNKNNMLFILDRQYRSDQGTATRCNIGYGALYIYKKNLAGQWLRNQKLKHIGGINSSGVEAAEVLTTAGNTNTSLKWNSLENGYGESGIDASENLLVVGTPREDFNRFGPNYKGHAGAVYLYRRSSSTSSYALVKLVFDSSPWNQTRFAGGGVSLNGNKFAAVTQIDGGTSTMSLFSLTENNVNQLTKINLPSTWANPFIQGTTENKIMVMTTLVNGVNSVFLYKIVNNGFQSFNPAANINISGHSIEKVSVNSNYFVVHYKNQVTGKNRFRVFIVSSTGEAAPFEVSLPAEFENKAVAGLSVWGNTSNPLIVEARTLAVTFKDPAGIEAPVVGYFKFNTSQITFEYKTKMTLPSIYAANASFAYGEKLIVTDTDLIISDSYNKTFDSSDDGTNQQCSEIKAAGIVFVHNRTNFETAGPGGFRMSDTFETEGEEILAPNPAGGDFAEFISKEDVKEVTATDAAGRSFNLNAEGNRINIADLESGLYIFRIKTDTGIKTKKLNIQ